MAPLNPVGFLTDPSFCMTRIYMVRHGRASAGWDTATDPPLDAFGEQQAAAVARTLGTLGPIDIVTSPLVRCRETAQPLAQLWAVEPRIEPGITEIPSPTGYSMRDRLGWLRQAMAGNWSDLDSIYTDYRNIAYETIRAMPTDTVAFSHFVAINAVIGKVLNDDRVLIDSLDNCSVTVFEVSPSGEMDIIQRGHEADTLIR